MLAQLHTKACEPCADAFAFHKFAGFNYWPTVTAKAADIRNRLAAYGWQDIDLWLTEFGSPSGPYSRTEQSQANDLLQMAESARDEGGIPVAVVYSAIHQAGQQLGIFETVPPSSVIPHMIVPTLGAMPR